MRLSRTLGRRELDQLDGVEVLHAAAHALGGVEQHVGLGGVRIAQHVDALAVDHQIAAIEIADGLAIHKITGQEMCLAEDRGLQSIRYSWAVHRRIR
jgi:hypothetical protein